jgi:hypothetical protein
VVRIGAEPAHRDHRGGAAIDQAAALLGRHHEAGLKAASAPERITAAENPKPHLAHFWFRDRSPRAEDCSCVAKPL